MEHGDDKRARRRRPATGPSPAYVQRAAMAYLARFATGAENLRRVLRAKARRRALRAGLDWTPAGAGEAEAWIGALVARLVAQGLVDDVAYAAMKARAMRARGASARAIRARLLAKGIDRATVDHALGDGERDELVAAVRYARRRRLGPYRAPDGGDGHRARDLAAMARAGFAYPLAREVVMARDRAWLEAAVADQGTDGT